MDLDVFTLAEAARRLRLSRVTLYRLARQGKLPGRKVGHSWRFHRLDVENWLRRPGRKNRLSKILEELREKLSALGRGRVRSVTLFGSHARGEAMEDSDLDLLVLVDERDRRLEQRLHEAAYEVMQRFGFSVVVTLTIMTADHFTQMGRMGYSLYRNITREGQPLWQAT